MKLAEAIVCLLAFSNQGMKTHQIACEINECGHFQRWYKALIIEKQIWAVVLSPQQAFIKSDGRMQLLRFFIIFATEIQRLYDAQARLPAAVSKGAAVLLYGSFVIGNLACTIFGKGKRTFFRKVKPTSRSHL